MRSRIFDLGLIEYEKARFFQAEMLELIRQEKYGAALILCRHNPVVTLGRMADAANIIVPLDELRKRKICVCRTERGGDVTFHGKGQLVAYPLIDLRHVGRDIHRYLRSLEAVALVFLGSFGIRGRRLPYATGVWAGKGKICSIGISVRHWVTFHGLAININDEDMECFSFIRPCGMDINMTSLQALLGHRVDSLEAKEVFIRSFNKVFPGIFDTREAVAGLRRSAKKEVHHVQSGIA